MRSISAPLCASSAPTLPCGRVEGGCFLAHPPQPLNRFDFPTISNQASVPFKEVACLYGAVHERNWHTSDVSDSRPQIPAVCTLSLSVFICVSHLLVDLQQSDNTVVPLPLPCDSVCGQVTIPTFLSDKKPRLTNQSCACSEYLSVFQKSSSR